MNTIDSNTVENKVDDFVTLLRMKGDDYALGYLISFIKSNSYFMDNVGKIEYLARLDTHISGLIRGMKKYEESSGKIPC